MYYCPDAWYTRRVRFHIKRPRGAQTPEVTSEPTQEAAMKNHTTRKNPTQSHSAAFRTAVR